MRIAAFAATLLTLAVVVPGCAKHDTAPGQIATRTAEATGAKGGKATGEAGEASESGGSPAATTERMVIKTATLTIESDDPDGAAVKARTVAEKANGFVVESEVQQWSEHANSVSLTLRVPSEKFDGTLDELRKLGDVGSETISGQDVTEEYLDVQAQLRNQKALESRFLELLSQAQTVADTLEVERELARVRTEIDRIEGRSKYLADQVNLSTIHFNANPTPTLAGRTTTIGSEIADAFGDSGEIIAVVIGGLIRFAAAMLPIGILAGLLGLGLRAIIRRRKSKTS